MSTLDRALGTQDPLRGPKDFDLSALSEIPDVDTSGAAPAADAAGSGAVRRRAREAGGVAARIEPGPTRAQVLQRQGLALGAGAVWVIGHLTILGLRPDLDRLSILYLVLQIGLPSFLALGAVGVAAWQGRRGLGADVRVPAGLALASVLAFTACTLFFPEPYEFVSPLPLSFLQWIIVCFDITLAVSAGPAILLTLALRRTFAAAAMWRSVAVGVGAGLTGAAMMAAHCSNVTKWHIVLGHGLPMVVLGVIGAVGIRHVTRI